MGTDAIDTERVTLENGLKPLASDESLERGFRKLTLGFLGEAMNIYIARSHSGGIQQ